MAYMLLLALAVLHSARAEDSCTSHPDGCVPVQGSSAIQFRHVRGRVNGAELRDEDAMDRHGTTGTSESESESAQMFCPTGRVFWGMMQKASQGPDAMTMHSVWKSSSGRCAGQAVPPPGCKSWPKTVAPPAELFGGRIDTKRLEVVKSMSVAIVGAGPSGLVMAKYLQDLGWDVTIFEKDGKLGGKAYTVEHGGKYFDLTTKWIPTMSVNLNPETRGHDPFLLQAPPLQQTFIDELEAAGKIKVVAGFGLEVWNTEDEAVVPVTPRMLSHASLKALSDLVHGVNVFFAIAACPGVRGVVDCSVAELDDTLDSWGKRHGLEALADFVAEYEDALGNGQGGIQHMGYALKSRSYFLLGTVMKKLVRAGIFATEAVIKAQLLSHGISDETLVAQKAAEAEKMRSLLPPMVSGDINWGQALMNNPMKQAQISHMPDSKYFDLGYDGFWKAFAEHYNLSSRVKFNSKVTRVANSKSDDDKVVIEVDNDASSSQVFDHVVVAVPPAESQAFRNSTVASSFAIDATAHPIKSMAFSTESKVLRPSQAPQKSHLMLYPAVCEENLGSITGVANTGKLTTLGLDDLSDGLVVGLSFPNASQEEREAEELHSEQLAKVVGEAKQIDSVTEDWPSVVSAARFPEFTEQVAASQGKRRHTFVGEEIFGGNVPAIIEGVAHLVQEAAWRV